MPYDQAKRRFETVLLSVTPLPAFAQESTGVPGSPSTTTAIDGKQLPSLSTTPPSRNPTGERQLNKLTRTIDRPKLTPEDIKKLETAQRNNKASE